MDPRPITAMRTGRYYTPPPYSMYTPPRMPRRIGVVSVGRSDRGHLAPLLALLPEATLHELDMTAPENAGNRIEQPYEVADAAGRALRCFTLVLHERPCDLLVVFGDRWEQLAAATAAHILGIPIVHLHAGETTEAVYDDGFRAAISALATHHVAAAEPYAERLRQQGYRSVHCLGAPGLGRLPQHNPVGSRHTLILVQFHPETRNLADIPRQVDELLHGIADIPAEFIITEPGMDAGREHIVKAFEGQFTACTDDEWMHYLSIASVLVGNSSCGIIETPSIPLPSVNIGDRQTGRLMADSVISVPHDRVHIAAAIRLAIDGPVWRGENLTGVNPYGDRGAAQRIAAFLKTCRL